MEMGVLDFEEERVESFGDVVEKVTEIIMRPNLKIAIGSGKVIFELIEWLKTNVKKEKCRGIKVYCSLPGQVPVLANSGVDAHLGVPDETGEYNIKNQLDYFFEMPERMNEDLTFVKFSNECAHRKQLFAIAKQSVFFYFHKKNEIFQSIKAIPLELSRGYYQHLKRTLITHVATLQHPRKEAEVEEEDENVVKMDWIWDPKSSKTKDITAYCAFLDRLHGLIAHGVYQNVDGYLIRLTKEDNEEVQMTSMPLKMIQKL